MDLRERVYYLIEPGDDSGRFIDAAILALIFLNIVALVLETVAPVYDAAPRLFEAFDTFSLVVFTAEYATRVWACTAVPPYTEPVRGRLRYVTSPLALIDLAVILPFLLPYVGVDLRFMRAFRLVRFARILKLARYSTALRLLGRVVKGRRAELASIFFVLVILLVVSSSLMYLAEHDSQPDVFASIPATMWWGIITLTTVGYGDTYPVTAVGQCIAAVIAILGIGMFALPAGILGAGFVEELQKPRGGGARPEHCPHCGAPLTDPPAD